jgi:arylsulfatase A-like enzyme
MTKRDLIKLDLFNGTITGFIVWALIGLLWSALIVMTHRDSPYYLLDLPLFRIMEGLEVERVSVYKLFVPNFSDQMQFVFYSGLFHSVFGAVSGITAVLVKSILHRSWRRKRTWSDSRPFLLSWNLFLLIAIFLANKWQFATKGSLIAPFIPVLISLKVFIALILALITFFLTRRILSRDIENRSEISTSISKMGWYSRFLLILCVVMICIPGLLSHLGERLAMASHQWKSDLTLRETNQETAWGGNVILIIIDTLRADHLGCYGYERPITPNIDRLAEDGILFSTCISQAPWTIPSIMSIMTSMYPSVNGVMDSKGRLDPMRLTLAEALGEAGYRTAGLVSHTFVDARFGFGEGFEIFEERKGIHQPAEILNDLAISILEEIDGENFFFFIHYFDPHFPYEPPAPYDTLYQDNIPENKSITWKEMKQFAQVKNPLPSEVLDRYIALYDGEIYYNDAMIGEFIDYLKTSGLYDNTTIVLTADHGEEFKDHDSMGHTRTLYDELVHVPLLVKLPGSEKAGTVVENQVRSIDIAPTLLSITGVDIPPEFLGVDLSQFWTSDDTPLALPAYSETSRHAILRSIRTEDRKYIQNFRHSFYHKRPGGTIEREIYHLEVDKGETKNLAVEGGNSLLSLQEELFQWIWISWLERKSLPKEGGTEEVIFDRESLDRLRALGYVQ